MGHWWMQLHGRIPLVSHVCLHQLYVSWSTSQSLKKYHAILLSDGHRHEPLEWMQHGSDQVFLLGLNDVSNHHPKHDKTLATWVVCETAYQHLRQQFPVYDDRQGSTLCYGSFFCNSVTVQSDLHGTEFIPRGQIRPLQSPTKCD